MRIKMLTDDAFETIKNNKEEVKKLFLEDMSHPKFMDIVKCIKYDEYSEEIPALDFMIPNQDNIMDANLHNAKELFEKLSDVDAYILSDMKFWAWLSIKYYNVFVEYIKSRAPRGGSYATSFWRGFVGVENAIHHNLAKESVFGALYYTAKLLFDPSLEDPYEDFIWIEKKSYARQRLLQFTFARTPKTFKNVVRACKRILEESDDEIGQQEVLVGVSKASIAFSLDALSEEDVYNCIKGHVPCKENLMVAI